MKRFAPLDVIVGQDPIPADPRGDLALIGMTLLAAFEGCGHSSCERFDTQYDVDYLAENRLGRPVLISYRHQGDYQYRTISIRAARDNGSRHTQLEKIQNGKSLADVYVQAYPRWVMWASAAEIRAGIERGVQQDCDHPLTRRAYTGQVLLILCEVCAVLQYTARSAA